MNVKCYWWWCIWCDLLRECKFYECLNFIDDDLYDATYCENENFYECLNAIRMMLDMMQSILVNDNLMNGCQNWIMGYYGIYF